MKQKLIVLVISLCSFYQSRAQKHRLNYVSIAFTTMHTAYPFSSFSSLFYEEFHPGFQIGTGLNWSNKAKHDWFQTFEFGYTFHRYVQNSFALYTEVGYRYKFWKTFGAEAKIGGGYLHAVQAGKVFVLNDDGTYSVKNNIGRSQVVAGFSLAVSKIISTSGLSIFLEYQQRLQLPFINSYVPLLPSNMLMAGVKIPLKSK